MKCQLSGLVRPKTTAQSAVSSSGDCSTAATCHESATSVNSGSELDGKSNCENNEPNSSELRTSSSNIVSAGLAGLGAYSSSSGSENDEESS